MSDFDPFNLKPHQRQCPRCADGRLHSEPIGDRKVNLYCDTCNFRHIYEREPEPAAPAPAEAPPPTAPATNPQPDEDKPMPTKPDIKAMTPTEQARWRNAGKPDRDKFIAAGCPTPKVWAKQHANRKPADKRGGAKPGRKPKAAKATAPPPSSNPSPAPVATTNQTRLNVSLRFLRVEYEGPSDGIGQLLAQVTDAFK